MKNEEQYACARAKTLPRTEVATTSATEVGGVTRGGGDTGGDSDAEQRRTARRVLFAEVGGACRNFRLTVPDDSQCALFQEFGAAWGKGELVAFGGGAADVPLIRDLSTDPRPDLADTALWIDLFRFAWATNPFDPSGVYAMFRYLRAMGCQLSVKADGSLALRPPTDEPVKVMVAWMGEHAEAIRDLLRRAKEDIAHAA